MLLNPYTNRSKRKSKKEIESRKPDKESKRTSDGEASRGRLGRPCRDLRAANQARLRRHLCARRPGRVRRCLRSAWPGLVRPPRAWPGNTCRHLPPRTPPRAPAPPHPTARARLGAPLPPLGQASPGPPTTRAATSDSSTTPRLASEEGTSESTASAWVVMAGARRRLGPNLGVVAVRHTDTL